MKQAGKRLCSWVLLLAFPLIVKAQPSRCQSLFEQGMRAMGSVSFYAAHDYFVEAQECFSPERYPMQYIEAAMYRLESLRRAYEYDRLQSVFPEVHEQVRDIFPQLKMHKKEILQTGFDLFRVEFMLASGRSGEAIEMLDSLIAAYSHIAKTRRDSDFASRAHQSMVLRSDAYAMTGDFGKAISGYRQALEKIDSLGLWTSDGAIIGPHLRIAECYHALRKPQQVISEYEKIRAIIPEIDRKLEERIMHAYITIFDFYLDYAPDSARVYLDLMRRQEIDLDAFEAEISVRAAELNLREGLLAEARTALERAREIAIRTRGRKSDFLARTDLLLGQIYQAQGEHDQALEAAQNALFALALTERPGDQLSNPPLSSLFEQRELLEVLQFKSEVLSDLYYVRNDDQYLSASWETISLAVQLLKQLHTRINGVDDRALIIDYSYPVFEQALKLTNTYYTRNDGRSGRWLDTAFQLMEDSKALNLLDAVLHEQAMLNTGIPDSLVRREAKLTRLIDQQAEALRSIRKTKEAADGRESMLAERLQHAETEYGNLLRQLEREYPGYDAAKTTFISMEGILGILNDQQTFIEYFVTDQSFFALCISHKNPRLLYLPLEEPIATDVQRLENLRDEFMEKKTTSIAWAYIDQSHDIFRKIVEPCQPETRELIIVPDGALGYLSFAGLVTSISDGRATRPDLRNLDYMVHDFDVSYVYSGRLLKRLRDSERGPVEKERALACAPSFHSIPNLPQSSAEATMVHEMFGGTLLTGSQCTADTVRELLEGDSSPGIVHLATHGFANVGDGTESFVIFSGSAGDTYLYARHLHRLNIDAELVYLASCESGTGELKSGEGVISLARAFFHAGAQSLVTSLWVLDDYRSSQITQMFYNYLDNGLSRQRAVAMAQREYLANLEPGQEMYAHPAYWSPLILLGDTGPVVERSGNFKWILLVSGVVLIITLLVFRKKNFR